jgi:hypothetical protein
VNVQALGRRARGLGYDPAAFRLEDGGGCFLRHFPAANLRAEIEAAEFDRDESAVRLDLVFHRGGDPKDPRRTFRMKLGEIPSVLFSECRADLSALAGSG